MKVLLAEDDPQVRAELRELLGGESLEVVTAADGIEAFEKFREDDSIELLLLDIRMPRCTGLQTLEAIKKTEGVGDRVFEAIFITGNNDSESVVTALKLGAFSFLFKPIDATALFAEIDQARDQINVRRYRRFQQQTLQAQLAEDEIKISRLSQELTHGFGSAVELLAMTAEYYIPGIELHLHRIGEMSACLGQRLQFEQDHLIQLRLASMLHDVGKVRGPDALYNAERTLTPEEFAITKEHTHLGEEFLNRSSDPIFQMAAKICAQHHEHYDGSGYPEGLSGDQLTLEACIVHVVDVYDNLRAPRPYREALAHHEAIDIIINGDAKSSPDHFHPRVLQALLSKHRDVEAIYERYKPLS